MPYTKTRLIDNNSSTPICDGSQLRPIIDMENFRSFARFGIRLRALLIAQDPDRKPKYQVHHGQVHLTPAPTDQ